MNETTQFIKTLQDVQNSMEKICHDLRSERENILTDIHRLEGKQEYIESCPYIPEDVKDKETHRISYTLLALVAKLMCLQQEDWNKSINKYKN